MKNEFCLNVKGLFNVVMNKCFNDKLTCFNVNEICLLKQHSMKCLKSLTKSGNAGTF